MTDRPTPLILRITPHLDLVEKILLTGLLIGFVLMYFDMDKTIIKASLLCLSITYFLSAFKFIDIPRTKDEKFEFVDLLALTITPKVLWISTAISMFGLFIYTLQLGHEGHKKAFMNGGLGIAVGLAILGYAALTGVKHLKYVTPPILRAIPLLLTDFYLLFN